MPQTSARKILIAPLDWGAGHTTRCLPLIAHLRALGHQPVFAGNAAQQAIVRSHMGADVTMLPLEGYNITYSPLNRLLQAGLLLQAPRILAAIKAEHEWLLRTVADNSIDGIISDNRYGLWHPTVPSVIITHQLQVLTGAGEVADAAVRQLHYRMLARFGQVWVPDVPEENGLAGRLAHPLALPPHTTYIGWLSRYAGSASAPAATHAPLLVLLSGPEPQRTLLSQLLWQQALRHDGPVLFAEGTDHATRPAHIPPHVQWCTRLAGDDLQKALQEAALVVCRSGYSTLMDLAATGNRALLIPTPGQTEQEYLARHLEKKGEHMATPQSASLIRRAFANWGAMGGRNAIVANGHQLYQPILAQWAASLPQATH